MRDECYLEFVAELLSALLGRNDEHVRDLLADVRATLLPGGVLREVRSILLLPPDSSRAPIQTLQHLRRIEASQSDAGVAPTDGLPGDDSRDDSQLELDLARR